MAWVLLIVASCFEVLMALGLKWSHGFTRLGGSLLALAASIVSMTLLALALRPLPVGTGYAVWTGLGAVFTALVGIVALGESRDALRLAGSAAVGVGVGLLQLTEPH